jgi:uncharacterized protein YecE (DUF72 family)
LDKFNNLKKKAELAQREADKAQGALDQILFQLSEEFNCDNLEDAEKLCEKLAKEEEKAKANFNKALADFKEKYD